MVTMKTRETVETTQNQIQNENIRFVGELGERDIGKYITQITHHQLIFQALFLSHVFPFTNFLRNWMTFM